MSPWICLSVLFLIESVISGKCSKLGKNKIVRDSTRHFHDTRTTTVVHSHECRHSALLAHNEVFIFMNINCSCFCRTLECDYFLASHMRTPTTAEQIRTESFRIVSFHFLNYGPLAPYEVHFRLRKNVYIIKWKTIIKCTNHRISDFIAVFILFYAPLEIQRNAILFVSHIPRDVIIFSFSIDFVSLGFHTVERIILADPLYLFASVCRRVRQLNVTE